MGHTTARKPIHSTTRVIAKSGLSYLGGSQYAVFPIEWIPLLPNPTALTVFLVLLAHANPAGRCFPKLSTVAKLACIDRRHVRRAIRELESIGAIETTVRGGHPSTYRILPPKIGGAESALSHVKGGAESALPNGAKLALPPGAESALPRNSPRNSPYNSTRERDLEAEKQADKARMQAAKAELAAKRAEMRAARELALKNGVKT
jgi:hypothetical protein